MVERAAEDGRELRREDLLKAEHLLRQALVTRHQQPRRARSRVAKPDQIQQRRDVRLERALSIERLREIEHQRWLGGPQRGDHGLDVGHNGNPRGLVTERAERRFDLPEHRILWRSRRIAAMQ
jgi:hypothetical protein